MNGRKLDAINLRGVEDAVALEKECRLLVLRAVAILHGPVVAAEFHDKRAAFAFANAAPALVRLAEGHPPRRREMQQAEQQDVHALILAPGVEVSWSASGSIPRAAPRNGAALQVREDGVGDELIRICASRLVTHGRCSFLCGLWVAR